MSLFCPEVCCVFKKIFDEAICSRGNNIFLVNFNLRRCFRGFVYNSFINTRGTIGLYM